MVLVHPKRHGYNIIQRCELHVLIPVYSFCTAVETDASKP